MAWAALTSRPDAGPAGQAGGGVLDDGQQLGAVAGELAPGLAKRGRQAADPGLPDGLLAAGMARELPAGQRGRGLAGQGLTGGAAAGVVPGQQQGPQPSGLRRCTPR